MPTMLTFLGFYPNMSSDFDFALFAFVTGLGADMRVPSPRPEVDADGEDGHVATEPRLQPASTIYATIAADGRLEEVPSSPSPLVLQPIQLPEDESWVNLADSTLLLSRSPTPILDPVSEIIEEDIQIAALPEQALIYQPGRSGNTGGLAEHILAAHPQLAPIPEETIAEEETRTTSLLPNSSLPLNSAPATFPAVEHSTESAWIPPAPTTTEAPAQAPILQSFINTQNTSSSFPPPPDPPSYSEDTGDSSSAASTNDEGSSVFDDDDYYSDTSSYTASLLSDVKNYTYENGRRYHSYREGHYVLPNDEQEQDRQDLLHHVRNLVLNGGLFRAPVGKNIRRVLDIGTGTGIWAIDFADTFPSAEVIGTDLSPIQPSWVPPNLRFLVDDAESPWLYSASRPFDFIHARDLGGAIADWPRLLRQAYEHLRPGGWVELQEFEVTLRSDDDSLRLAPTLCEFLGRLHEASEAFHRPMNIAEGHRQRLAEAGFENVRDEVYKVRRDFPV
jgi:SAM-dependent methyltransferase